MEKIKEFRIYIPLTESGLFYDIKFVENGKYIDDFMPVKQIRLF